VSLHFYREALETCMNEPAESHTPANPRFNQAVRVMIGRQSQQQHCLYSDDQEAWKLLQ
jgi:hypothetical protein